MKYIVSGDQHLYVPKSLPQDWCMNRFRLLWDFYVDKCKEHNAGLILAGDLAHTTKPNLAETQLLIELLIKLKDNNIETYIISGNHENIGNGVSCLDHFADLFSEMGVFYVKADVSQNISFVGHTHLNDAILNSSLLASPVLVTHVRPTINQFIQEEVNVAKLIEPYQLVVAGDIHMPLELFDGKLVYTNAPLNNHFEDKPNTGVVLLDTETLKWSRISTNHLPQLVQVTCKADEFDALALQAGNHYRVEVTGTPQELRKIATEDPYIKLLKVPEVVDTYVEVEDAVEIRDLVMEEALIEYMKELKFEEDRITKMITVLKGV